MVEGWREVEVEESYGDTKGGQLSPPGTPTPHLKAFINPTNVLPKRTPETEPRTPPVTHIQNTWTRYVSETPITNKDHPSKIPFINKYPA
jgi:hypothetical protein